MKSMLAVTPGSVTPLAVMNDSKYYSRYRILFVLFFSSFSLTIFLFLSSPLRNQVTFVFDEAFRTSEEPLIVHPLHNEGQSFSTRFREIYV